jgi:hypothetical protein
MGGVQCYFRPAEPTDQLKSIALRRFLEDLNITMTERDLEEQIGRIFAYNGKTAYFSGGPNNRSLEGYVFDPDPDRKSWGAHEYVTDCPTLDSLGHPCILELSGGRNILTTKADIMIGQTFIDVKRYKTAQATRPKTPPSPKQTDAGTKETEDQQPHTPQQPNRQAGWAVYCRIPHARTAHARAEELAKQRAACAAYAEAHNLLPVGPNWYFEDVCSEKTGPNERPGLQALIASGATGIICLSRKTMSPRTENIQPWLDSLGLGLRTLTERWCCYLE